MKKLVPLAVIVLMLMPTAAVISQFEAPQVSLIPIAGNEDFVYLRNVEVQNGTFIFTDQISTILIDLSNRSIPYPYSGALLSFNTVGRINYMIIRILWDSGDEVVFRVYGVNGSVSIVYGLYPYCFYLYVNDQRLLSYCVIGNWITMIGIYTIYSKGMGIANLTVGMSNASVESKYVLIGDFSNVSLALNNMTPNGWRLEACTEGGARIDVDLETPIYTGGINTLLSFVTVNASYAGYRIEYVDGYVENGLYDSGRFCRPGGCDYSDLVGADRNGFVVKVMPTYSGMMTKMIVDVSFGCPIYIFDIVIRKELADLMGISTNTSVVWSAPAGTNSNNSNNTGSVNASTNTNTSTSGVTGKLQEWWSRLSTGQKSAVALGALILLLALAAATRSRRDRKR